MSAALDTILLDSGSFLEIAVEIDSAKRSDGTLRTWYCSTNNRETGAAETPANTEFFPFIRPGGSLGPLTQSLTEDVLFAGLAENSPGSLTLLQVGADSDQLSQMNDYVFAGYQVRIKIGRTTDLYASFVTYRTVTVNIDPIVQSTSEGIQASFSLSSALQRLIDEPIILKHHLGIPHCLQLKATATGVITATKQTVHDAKRFTIGMRFRFPAAPAAGSTRRLWTKSAADPTNDSHWFIRIGPTGALFLLATSASAPDIQYTSPSSLCDDRFHSFVYSRDDNLTAYIMIDGGEETTFTPLGTVNASNANLVTGAVSGTACVCYVMDQRFLDRYMTPDEARSYFSTRSAGDDLNVIGLWCYDDNTGAVVDDSSSTNANGAIAGVVNTDYAWAQSDLGEPEIAGTPYPVNVGNVLNAKAQLIDGVRERYRGNNDSTGWVGIGLDNQLVVRSQGTVLTGGGVDYTLPGGGNDGVFNTTSQEAEPLTYDLIFNSSAENLTYPSKTAERLLTQRTRITALANADPISLLCPWPAGYYTASETTAKQALADILGQSGLYYCENSLGSLHVDMMLPVTGYGPYSEACFDLRGQQNGYHFGNRAGASSNFTLCGWVKINLSDQTAFNFAAAGVGTIYFISKDNSSSGNYSLFFEAVGQDAGKLVFRTASVSLKSTTGALSAFGWYFVAGVFDDTNNIMRLYAAPRGGTLIEIGNVANAGTPTTNTDFLKIGGTNAYNWCSTQHMQVWNSAKSLAQLQALMATPPVGNESGLLAYIPGNEGENVPKEIVSNTTGTMLDTSALIQPQWAPKFTVNLNDTPTVKLSDFHHLNPASEIIVRYAKNRYPMTEADIDTGVSQSNRLALVKEWKDVRYENSVIRGRYKNSKKIEFNSLIVDQESAIRLLRVTKARFGTDNYIGSVKFAHPKDALLNISCLACGLAIGDEIGLIGPIPSQIQTQRCFKVVSVSPNLLKLENSIVICG